MSPKGWARVERARPASDVPGRIDRLSRAQDDLVDAGDLEGAQQLLASWLADHPEEDAHIPRLELARVLFWRGQPGRARALLEALREDRPDDGWVASFLGQVLARHGEHDAARTLFAEAMSLDPGNHEARLFLGGDDLGDALRARRMLTHGALPPRGRIELAALCAALDFRRGRHVQLERGELTQAFLDRANLLVDVAAPGEDVEAELSLRPALERADRVAFYTSQALGDALLGLSAVDALAAFFELHPELRRPVEILTPHDAVMEGFAERYPFVTLERLCGPRDPDEAWIAADDLRRREGSVLALVGSSPSVAGALVEVALERGPGVSVVDVQVDRYARDLASWLPVTPPRARLLTLPARLHRFMEILLGCRLADHPARVQVSLPLGTRLRQGRELLLRRYHLHGTDYHVVVESASKPSKVFAPDLLREFICELANQCELLEGEGRPPQRIAFSRDVKMERSFAVEIGGLPERVRSRVVIVDEDLPGVTVLLAGAQTVVSTDTGLAHVAAALGRPTVILYSVADPWLWHTGGANVRTLWSPQALDAHCNATPVNMSEWESTRPLMDGALGTRDLLDAWRRCAGR
ncbi:MAG TPA: tetratricopeptide repeat protein [Myxococcaceae bacterium]